MKDQHRASGTSSIEMVIGTMLIVPVVLLALDVSAVFFGSALAGSACRTAARSASNGMPADLSGPHTNTVLGQQTPPYLRAKTALSSYQTNNTIKLDPAIKVTETIVNPVPVLPLGGEVNGQVTVDVHVVVAPLFTLAPFPQTVDLSAEQTFPYTCVIPPTLP